MKLYTEEEVRQAIEMARTGVRSDDNIIGSLNFIRPPMELPSDEEIYNKCSNWVFRENPTKWSVNDDTAGDNMNSFANGAKWMRDKLTNTKEK